MGQMRPEDPWYLPYGAPHELRDLVAEVWWSCIWSSSPLPNSPTLSSASWVGSGPPPLPSTPQLDQESAMIPPPSPTGSGPGHTSYLTVADGSRTCTLSSMGGMGPGHSPSSTMDGWGQATLSPTPEAELGLGHAPSPHSWIGVEPHLLSPETGSG